MKSQQNIYNRLPEKTEGESYKNKSKIDIWKILGVDFFQDYLLPTNILRVKCQFINIYIQNSLILTWLKIMILLIIKIIFLKICYIFIEFYE